MLKWVREVMRFHLKKVSMNSSHCDMEVFSGSSLRDFLLNTSAFYMYIVFFLRF